MKTDMATDCNPCTPQALRKIGPLLLACLLWACMRTAAAADFAGIVHARHDLVLSVAVPGVVAKVVGELGRKVEAGQVLLQLDDRTQVTEIERRKIMLEDLSEVQATDERVKILKPLFEDVRKLQATRGAVSRDEAARVELDYIISHGRAIQLEAQKRREKLELTFAEQDRQLRRLVAPVAGVVARLDVNLGEWAKPGDPLVRLVDASVCHLRVNVPATAALGLREGSSMTVRFEPGLGLPDVQGVVSFLSPAVDASSGLVELRLKFNNPTGRIAPGIKGFIRLGAAK